MTRGQQLFLSCATLVCLIFLTLWVNEIGKRVLRLEVKMQDPPIRGDSLDMPDSFQSERTGEDEYYVR